VELFQIYHDDSANIGIYINFKATLAVYGTKEGIASLNAGQDEDK
jgi:hypothetical protein